MYNLEKFLDSEGLKKATELLDEIFALVRKGADELPQELYVYMIAVLEARAHATVDDIAGLAMEQAALVAEARFLGVIETASKKHTYEKSSGFINALSNAANHEVDLETCKACEKRENCGILLAYLDDNQAVSEVN